MYKKLSLLVLLLLLSFSSTGIAFGSTYKYVYDANNRLVQIEKDGQPYRSFTYDANGNRLRASYELSTVFTRSGTSVQSDGTMVVKDEARIEAGAFTTSFSSPSKNLLTRKQATGKTYSLNYMLSPKTFISNNLAHSITTTRSWEGETSVQISRTSANIPYLAVDLVLPNSSAGQMYTFSAYVTSDNPNTALQAGYLVDQTAMQTCGAPVKPNNQWARITCTSEAKEGTDGQVHLQYFLTSTSSNFTTSYLYYVDGLQVEAGSVATDFVIPDRNGTALMIEDAHMNLWGSSYWATAGHNWLAYSTDNATGSQSVVANKQTIVLEKTDEGLGRWGVTQPKTVSSTALARTQSFRFKKQSASEGAVLASQSNYVLNDGTTLQNTGVEVDLTTMTIVANGGIGTIQLEQDGWYKVVFTTTKFAAAPTNCESFFFVEGGPAKVVIDQAQLNSGTYETSFTPYSSATDSVTVPFTRQLRGTEGTVELMVYVTSDLIMKNDRAVYLFDVAPTKTNIYARGIKLMRSVYPVGYTVTSYNDLGSSSSFTVNLDKTSVGWHRFAVTWSPAQLNLYIDGKLTGSKTLPKLPSQLGYGLSIGSSFNSGVIHTLIDDVRFSSIARSAEELEASYNSNQPLPVDFYTLYKSKFDQL